MRFFYSFKLSNFLVRIFSILSSDLESAYTIQRFFSTHFDLFEEKSFKFHFVKNRKCSPLTSLACGSKWFGMKIFIDQLHFYPWLQNSSSENHTKLQQIWRLQEWTSKNILNITVKNCINLDFLVPHRKKVIEVTHIFLKHNSF